MWTHLRDVTYVARLPHQCSLCGLPIPVRTTYVVRTGVDSGKGLCRMTMHRHCERYTAANFAEEDWEGGPDERGFLQELQAAGIVDSFGNVYKEWE